MTLSNLLSTSAAPNHHFYGIFTKYAESFRTPNIDERIKSTTSGSFALNDQSAEEIEIGVRYENQLFNILI